MIRNVIFDMGNVLIRFAPREFIRRCGVEDEKDRELIWQEVFHSVTWVRLDRGDCTEEEAVAEICKKLPERLHSAARQVITGWALPDLEIAETQSLAQTLSDKGYTLYLFTNAGEGQRRYFRQYPAAQLFEGRVFLSADWKLLKPSTEYFEAAMRHFSLRPEECLFIDDAPYNVEAAIRVGLDGIVYHGDPKRLTDDLRAHGIDI